MFLMSCFYVAIAFFSLYLFHSIKKKHSVRRVYTRDVMISNQETQKVPDDWKPVPVSTTKDEKYAVEEKEVTKQSLIETFILKEIENSVKELEKKRVPFACLDSNVMNNSLNPNVGEFLPKARLNPMAEDFRPRVVTGFEYSL